MKSKTLEQIIEQEKQLLARQDPIECLAELIDDDFLELGKHGRCDKKEALHWLGGEFDADITASNFLGQFLCDEVVLLTYVSIETSQNTVPDKMHQRASIWRQRDGRWALLFHQGSAFHGER